MPRYFNHEKALGECGCLALNPFKQKWGELYMATEIPLSEVLVLPSFLIVFSMRKRIDDNL